MESRSVVRQLADLGHALPKPRKADRLREARMQRSPIGAKKRAAARREEDFYPAWEQTLNLHRLDFWHCYNPMFAKESGWPDYVVFGRKWLAFVELKARSIHTGRIGKLSVEQQRYKASVEAAGAEWQTFVFPDDWKSIDAWLEGKSGRTPDLTWRETESAS
jgi:hypothetical protein